MDILMCDIFRSLWVCAFRESVSYGAASRACSARGGLSGRQETVSWWTKSPMNMRLASRPGRGSAQSSRARGTAGDRERGQVLSNPKGKNPFGCVADPECQERSPGKDFPIRAGFWGGGTGRVSRACPVRSRRHSARCLPGRRAAAVTAAIQNRRLGYGCDVSEEYVGIAPGPRPGGFEAGDAGVAARGQARLRPASCLRRQPLPRRALRAGPSPSPEGLL